MSNKVLNAENLSVLFQIPMFEQKLLSSDLVPDDWQQLESTLPKEHVDNYRLLSRHTSDQDLQKILGNDKKRGNFSIDGTNGLHKAGLLTVASEQRFELFLKAGADINMRDNGKHLNTPLQNTIANENVRNTEILLRLARKNNVKINFGIVDAQGKTPLILAAAMRRNDLVDLLNAEVEHGADLHVNTQDKLGRTALHYACMMGNLPLVKTLSALGASWDICDLNKKRPQDLILTDEKDIINALSSVAIDPNRDENALSNNFTDLNLEKLMLLKNNRPTTDEPLVTTKKNFKTFKNTVEKKNVLDFKELYLQTRNYKGPKSFPTLSTKDKNDLIAKFNNLTGTSLVQSCVRDQVSLLKFVLDCPDKIDCAFLCRHAASRGNINAVQMIVTQQPDCVNKSGPSRETALHQAVKNTHSQVAIFLLEHDADPNAQDAKNSTTPMHIAAKLEQENVLTEMVRFGGDLEQKNSVGDSAESIITKAGKHELLDKLNRKVSGP